MDQASLAEEHERLVADDDVEGNASLHIDMGDEETTRTKTFAHIGRLLYTSHFLSTWNTRVFEFGAFLFLAGVNSNSLLPASIYALSGSAAAVVSSHWVGRRIDSLNRLKVVRQSILGQRLAVTVSCAVLGLMAWHPRLVQESQMAFPILLAFLVALAAVEKICAVTNLIAVERDWVVTIACEDEHRLRRLNSLMRRIDLFCKLVGPLSISLVDEASPKAAILLTAGMTLASLPVEYFTIAWVYKAVPALRVPKLLPDHEVRVTGYLARMQDWARSSVSKVRWYTGHRVFLASLSLSLLYITVLSFSGPMTVFLLALGMPPGVLGGVRAISALFELSATWIAPQLMKRVGPVRSGIWFLNWQTLFVSAACLCLWIDIPPKWAAAGLVCTVALSRLGLWGFDLSAQFLIQAEVAEQDRGRFSAQETSLQNLGEMVAFASTIIFSEPAQFKYPATMSAGAIGLAAMLYAVFVRGRRGHLVHWEKCTPCYS